MPNFRRPTNMPPSTDTCECFVVNCCAAFDDPPFQIISHRLACGPAVELCSAIRASGAVATDGPLAPPPDRPHFDSVTGELWFGGRVVRVYCPRAKNCLRVLRVFQEEGWPRRIDDPLPTGRDDKRLSDTVRTMNKKLSGIQFYSGGDGESFCWKVKN